MKCAVVLIVALLSEQCLTANAQSVSGVASGQVVLVDLSTPAYPPLARLANIMGNETVLVTVKPNGTVESAAVESGHPMLVLRQAAMDSASKSAFQCSGCKENMAYRLVYGFKIVQGPDCCDARTVAPRVALHAEGLAQSHVDVEAEQVCICDPPSVMTKRVRSLKCLYLWKCSSR